MFGVLTACVAEDILGNPARTFTLYSTYHSIYALFSNLFSFILTWCNAKNVFIHGARVRWPWNHNIAAATMRTHRARGTACKLDVVEGSSFDVSWLRTAIICAVDRCRPHRTLRDIYTLGKWLNIHICIPIRVIQDGMQAHCRFRRRTVKPSP